MAADAAGGVWEGADDEAASAKEAPRALKENPYEVGALEPVARQETIAPGERSRGWRSWLGQLTAAAPGLQPTLEAPSACSRRVPAVSDTQRRCAS